MSEMPIVYVAGPYRGRNQEAVALNISSAKQVGLLAVAKGWSPLIPHMNTAHMDILVGLPDQFWIDATMALMLRCDAVVLCPGWECSEGTLGEIRGAHENGIPVYETITELPKSHDFKKTLTKGQAREYAQV